MSPSEQPGILAQLTMAAEERPWLWVIYILTVGLPVGLAVLFCWPKVLAGHIHPDGPHRTSLTGLNPVLQKVEEDYVYKKTDLPGADLEEEEEDEEEAADEDKAAEAADEAAAAAAGLTSICEDCI